MKVTSHIYDMHALNPKKKKRLRHVCEHCHYTIARIVQGIDIQSFFMVFFPFLFASGELLFFWDKTYFSPFIFTRFSLWSLTFFFTAFSPYSEKCVSFQSLTLHQRRKLHSWQTEKNKNIKIIPTNATSFFKNKKLICKF